MLDDESAANYADELGLADAVLEERRKEARRLAAEMLNKKPEDKSKWPKFSGNKEAPEEDDGRGLFGAALQGGVLDNVFGGPAPRFELTAEKMEDPELQSVVRRQMIDAFDNRREDEVDVMFARLWHAGPIKTVKKLVEAVLDAQDVYQAYADDLLSDERAADEIRCCRSRIKDVREGRGVPAERRRVAGVGHAGVARRLYPLALAAVALFVLCGRAAQR